MKAINDKKEIKKKIHPWQLKHVRINRGGVIWKSHRKGFASFKIHGKV